MKTEEQTYPIYRFSAKWHNITEQSYKDYPKWTDGLSVGRMWNSTSFSKMYIEEKTQGWLDNYIMEWWDKYVHEEKNKDKDFKLLSLKAEYFEHETWHLTWFMHETFDVGQTNEEALASFERFVSRKQTLNERSQYEKREDTYCLMGAEDRWRWYGLEPSGDPLKDHSPAPCRCKFCKEAGLIRIAH
jgi:hypothetical protein